MVEIANTFSKLLIVYFLYIGDFDKLIQYSVLVLLVSIGVAMYYRYYAVNNFEEATIRPVFDKPMAKEIGMYTAYTLFPTFAWIGKRNIVVMLINMFFGVAVKCGGGIGNDCIWNYSRIYNKYYYCYSTSTYYTICTEQKRRVSCIILSSCGVNGFCNGDLCGSFGFGDGLFIKSMA